MVKKKLNPSIIDWLNAQINECRQEEFEYGADADAFERDLEKYKKTGKLSADTREAYKMAVTDDH
jgi:hypothetical protein